MAFSEANIRVYIKALVEEYGELTVTEIDEILRTRLKLDDEDKKLLLNRNDDAFSQKVRNVVSHSGSSPIADKYGFIIDKTQTPAKFYAKNAPVTIAGNIAKLDLEKLVLPAEEIKKRRMRKKKYIARKVDFERIHEENTLLGELGEYFALEWERTRLNDLETSIDVLNEVIHVSKQYGDGSGYDILSKKDAGGSVLYIEVKTTKGGADVPFFMSKNEKSFMEEYSENAVIYRVYDFDYSNKCGKVLKITHEELERDYCFEPTTFKVMRK